MKKRFRTCLQSRLQSSPALRRIDQTLRPVFQLSVFQFFGFGFFGFRLPITYYTAITNASDGLCSNVVCCSRKPLVKFFRRDRTFTQPVNPVIFFFLAILHVGAVVALFFFTWKAVAMGVVLWWVAGSLGIGMGYHRLLTHRGYKTPKWMEYFLTICGTLALEGGPIAWVPRIASIIRTRDKEGDPHSPHDGGLWAHIGWIITGEANAQHGPKNCCRMCPTSQRQISHVDQRVALGSARNTRRRAVCSRRMVIRALGHLFSYRIRPAFHLASELRQHTCGDRGASVPAIHRPIVSGSRCSPSAKAGTTTISASGSLRVTGSHGTRST